MVIKQDDLTGEAIIALIGEHLQNMAADSPPESVHALNLDGLRRPDITFWSVWEEGALMGCGALKELDPRHGEIKSMRTTEAHRKKGVARTMLQHIIAEARRRGYHRLNLETGSIPQFEAARALYASAGFQVCEPFADYIEDPYSVFMTLDLNEPATASAL